MKISPPEPETNKKIHKTKMRPSAETQFSILNALPAHVALIDNLGRILLVNDAWRHFTTENVLQSPEVGKNYLNICDATTGEDSLDAHAAAAGIRQVLRGEVKDFAMEYPCPSSEEPCWFRLMATPVDHGEVSGAVVMHVNITDRKQAEEALKRSEASLVVAQRISHFGSWELDLTLPDIDGNALHWSDEMFRIAGFEPGSVRVTNELFFSLVPPEEHALIRETVAKAILDRKPYSLVHRLIQPDGTECIVHESAEIFFDEKTGGPTKMIGTAQNITSQRRAQEAIRLQAHMLNHIGQAVIATDTTGTVIYANRFAGELYGWSPQEMQGRNIMDVTVPKASKAQAAEIMGRLQSGESWSGEFIVTGRSGVEFPALVTNSPLLDEQGKTVGIIGISSDISQRKKAESDIERQAAFAAFNPNPVIELSATGEVSYFNSATMRLTHSLGFEQAEQILPPTTGQIVRDCLSTGRPWLRLEIETAGRVISWSFFPIPALQVVHGYAGDITDRKRAENERDRLFNLSIDMLCVGSFDGRLEQVNPAWTQCLGWSTEELTGRAWLDFVHPEDRAATQDNNEYLVIGKPVRNFENRYLCKDGSFRWLSWNSHSLMETRQVFAVARDVTERRESEAQLAEQAALLDKAQDAIIVRDLDHRILFWNHSARQLFGWTDDEVKGRCAADFLYSDRTHFLQAAAATISKGEWVGELDQITKAGKPLKIQGRWTLVRDSSGAPKSILTINTDVTEKKRLEAQFLRAQRMEGIGTLAGGIAHDLNNMLAPIMMSLEILKMKFPDSDTEDILNTLEKSAQRGSDLVRQVLSFARGVAGHRVLVDPVHIIKDIQKIVQDTFPKTVAFHLAASKNLWSITSDPTQMHQVFLNLCINARDAMPQGGRLSIQLENVLLDETYAAMNPDSKPGAYVLVKVEDTGTGIPPEVRDKIFEPFFTTKEIGEGTGLGLSTTLGIVKSHDGFINVVSELGSGTKFEVYLPAHTAAIAVEPAPVAPTKFPVGHGETVLLVDDEEAIRKIAQSTLERFGYRVLLASNGAQAVSLYARHQHEIAVVLTDMAMPIMDGATLIVAIKMINPSVRVMGSSGFTSTENMAKVAAAGVRHFIPKPYTAESMLKVLQAALQEKP
ncbi:MAG: PAS domain S-box protein [Chthoniobacterales bacterium]